MFGPRCAAVYPVRAARAMTWRRRAQLELVDKKLEKKVS